MPIAAVVVWLLLVRGSYRVAERVFVLMTIPFFAYPIAAILAKPDWGEVGRSVVAPHNHWTSAFVVLLIATAGTTITPFMQLYVQSAVVERGIGPEELNAVRAEVATGSIFAQGWTPELQSLVGGKEDAAGLLKAVQAEYQKELNR